MADVGDLVGECTLALDRRHIVQLTTTTKTRPATTTLKRPIDLNPGRSLVADRRDLPEALELFPMSCRSRSVMSRPSIQYAFFIVSVGSGAGVRRRRRACSEEFAKMMYIHRARAPH
jgi:hypothetical protein